MKRAIEFVENVKITHQVVVDCESESVLDNIADITADSFDDVISQIEDMGVEIIEASEEYTIESEELEYYDDYNIQ